MPIGIESLEIYNGESARGRKVPHDDWINDEISHENRIFMNQRKTEERNELSAVGLVFMKWAVRGILSNQNKNQQNLK